MPLVFKNLDKALYLKKPKEQFYSKQNANQLDMGQMIYLIFHQNQGLAPKLYCCGLF